MIINVLIFKKRNYRNDFLRQLLFIHNKTLLLFVGCIKIQIVMLTSQKYNRFLLKDIFFFKIELTNIIFSREVAKKSFCCIIG